MRRVTGLPDEQVTAWEAKLEQQVVDSLQSVMDKIAARIERIQVASAVPRVLVAVATTGPAGDDEPPPMTGELAIPEPVPLPEVLPPDAGLPPGQPYISPDDLASIAPMWQQAVADQILPLAAQVFIDSAGHVRSQFLDAVAPGVTLGLPGLGSVAAEEYLARAGNTFDEIGDHLWATARAQLSEGFEAGESIPQLGARLRQSAGLSARTGVMVARTQVIEASNAGSIAMARASRLEMLKAWQATNDRRTRPSHLAAEAQYEADPIPLNQPFIVGGELADFPAAATLSPAQRYGCRCTTLYLMPERQSALPGRDLTQLPGTAAPAAELEAEPAADEVLAKEPGELGFDLADFPEPPPIKVRSALLRARTDRELIAAWQGEMRAITGRDIIVQLPPDASMLTMREHAEGVLQMLERFPEARLRKISWYDTASTEYAHVKVGTATLEFNAKWASTAQRREYLASLRHDISGWDDAAGPGYGWSVRGAKNPQATSWHEMAHILSIETLGGKLKAEAMRITLRRMVADGGVDMGDYVSRQISAYAASKKGNLEEMIAEAMTDVMANGPRASLLSRELYDMVAREYRAKGFAVRTAEIPEGEAGFEEFTSIPDGKVFPKAAGPRALTSQTVAQLRALARERGITVPAGTRKADLVRMLDEGASAPVPAVGEVVGRLPGGFGEYTIHQLRVFGRERGIPDAAKMTERQLVRALDEAAPPPGATAFEVRMARATQGPQGVASAAPLDFARAEEFRRITDPLAVGLERTPFEAIQWYRGIEFHRLNDALRAAEVPAEVASNPWLQALDIAMDASPLRTETLTFRGLSQRGFLREAGGKLDLDGDLTGATWAGRTYISTSSDPSIAYIYGGRPDAPGVFMRVVSPEGTRGVAISGGEAELTLARGQQFRVVKDHGVQPTPGGPRRVLDVEVVPGGPPVAAPPLSIPVVPSAALPARVVAARAELERVRALPVLKDKSRRMSGANAYTTQVEHEGGPPTITKSFTRMGEGPAASRRRADAEELGALVSESAGIRAPAIIRTGPHSVEMEFIEGQPGDEFMQFGQSASDVGLTTTDDGRLLGLADILMGNSDRNAGNFIRLAGGRLAAVDHESAFMTARLAGADDRFGADLVGRERGKDAKWPKSIDIAPADLALIRQRLEALRPEFERLKRGTWFNQMMARLAEVEKRATGTRTRLAEAAETAVSPEARAVARQATIDERRAVADSLGEVRELLANGASERALASRARLIAGRTTGQAKADLDALVKAMESGDADRIRVALGDVAQRRGLTEVGGGSDVVAFDPKLHEVVGGARRPPVGTFVQVQRPGYSVRLDDGEVVQLSKAKVDMLTPEELAQARNKVVEPSLDAATSTPLAGQDVLQAIPVRDSASLESLTTRLEDAGGYSVGVDVDLGGIPGGKVRDGLADYSDNGYQYVNAALRFAKGDLSKIPAALPEGTRGIIPGFYSERRVLDQARAIDAIMERSAITSDIKVFRGIDRALPEWGDPERSLVGQVWREDAYVSTSVREASTTKFAGNGAGIRMRIHAPRGTRAIGVENSQPGLKIEQEVLLDRGLSYQVTADRVIGGVRTLDVEIVDRKVVREAARERNRVVEAQRATAKLLAEVDELAAKGATKTAIRERLDPALREAGQAYAGADAAVVDTISAALDSGDMAKIRAAVTRASTKAKIKPIGRAGARTTFDPDTMEGVGGIDIAPGAKVTVVRRGSMLPGVETPEKAQVTPVRAASTAKTVARGDFTGLTRVGEQMGSNPGGLFEAGDGSRWYIKTATDPTQLRSEKLALDLYREAGLEVPDVVVGQGAEGLGSTQIASRFLDDASRDLRQRLGEEAYRHQLQEGFAVDAWLGNWDVLGLGLDNVLTTAAGTPIRIEAGGALRFRAQGATKAFGDKVGEFDTMREAGRGAGRAFADMTPEQLIASAERVRKVTPAKVKALVKRRGLDSELAETLIARRADLLRRVEALTGPVPLTPAQYAARLKAAAKGQDALDAAPIDASAGTRGATPPRIEAVSEAQQKALIGYRGHGFGPVNDDLRGISPEEIDRKWHGFASREQIRKSRDDVVRIDEILDRSRLTDDVVLYRGAGTGRSILGDPDTWSDDLAGFTWRDAAYSSATASEKVAADFLRGLPGQSRLMLRLVAPRGTKAIRISNLGPDNADEAEMLLGRGATFRVVRDRGWSTYTSPTSGMTISRVRTLDVEIVVPDETPPPPWGNQVTYRQVHDGT